MTETRRLVASLRLEQIKSILKKSKGSLIKKDRSRIGRIVLLLPPIYLKFILKYIETQRNKKEKNEQRTIQHRKTNKLS